MSSLCSHAQRFEGSRSFGGCHSVLNITNLVNLVERIRSIAKRRRLIISKNIFIPKKISRTTSPLYFSQELAKYH